VNAQPQDLLRQLEQATATDSGPSPEMDEETALLRQTWLGLTQLLEAADADWDETVILARKPFCSTRPRWKSLTIAALAASLLTVVIGAWMSHKYLAPRVLVERAIEGDKTERLITPRKVASPEQSPTAQSSDELAWNDTFDERLADAELAMYRLRFESRHHEMRIEVLQSQLQTIENEVEAGSL